MPDRRGIASLAVGEESFGSKGLIPTATPTPTGSFNVGDFLRGLSLAPERIVGGPVDAANLVFEALGTASEKPVLGSDWLIERNPLRTKPPTGSAPEVAGDVVGGLLGPGGPAKLAATAGDLLPAFFPFLGGILTKPGIPGLLPGPSGAAVVEKAGDEIKRMAAAGMPPAVLRETPSGIVTLIPVSGPEMGQVGDLRRTLRGLIDHYAGPEAYKSPEVQDLLDKRATTGMLQAVISDKKAKLNISGIKKGLSKRKEALQADFAGGVVPIPKLRLGEVLDHKQLYEIAPKIKNVEVRPVDLPDQTMGGYNPVENVLTVNRKILDKALDGDEKSLESVRSTFLHEMQHWFDFQYPPDIDKSPLEWDRSVKEAVRAATSVDLEWHMPTLAKLLFVK
jgi:hypothetical protein